MLDSALHFRLIIHQPGDKTIETHAIHNATLQPCVSLLLYPQEKYNSFFGNG